MDDAELAKIYNSIYLEIIMRYRDQIEEQEGMHVAELPKLVTPENENVQLIASNIKDKFLTYDYDKHFLEAAKHAHQYVKDTIVTIDLPIQFWQRPADTIKYKAGELFDKTTLLCSILLALGSGSAKAIIAIKESERSFSTYFEFEGGVYSIDLDTGMTRHRDVNDMLVRLGIGSENEEVSAYEFNDKSYKDIA